MDLTGEPLTRPNSLSVFQLAQKSGDVLIRITDGASESVQTAPLPLDRICSGIVTETVTMIDLI